MEIELYSKLQNPIEAIDKLGDWLAKSGMFGCDKTEQGKIMALAMLVEKKSPFQLKREYHFYNGQMSDRADSMLAKFRGAGGKHRVLKRDAEGASVELTHDGNTQVFTFLWTDAEKEPFVWAYDKKTGQRLGPKTNYATPRARTQMLWSRVISEGVRTMTPEIVAGVYTPEEIDATDTLPAGQQINMAAAAPNQAPATTQAPVTKAEPIDVVSKVVPLPLPTEPVSQTAPPEDTKELAQAGLASVQPPTTTTAPASAPVAPGQETHVTDEMVEQVGLALVGNFLPALRWMLKEKWLAAPAKVIDSEADAAAYLQMNLKTVTSVRVRKILKNTASFLAAIGSGK
jgi:hypothetical protein